MGNINLLTVFLTGLFAGGLSCMAVQGGLLTATLAQREQERLQKKIKGGNALPIISFLVMKTLVYTALGVLLGTLGSVAQLSLEVRIALQIFIAFFMFGTALNLLEVHPIFRYFVIQPPRFLTHLVRKKSKSSDIFAPALVGALTVFIPCGTTQAMMALAIASANPLLGGVIMFVFTIGTSPLFFLLGFLATSLTGKLHQTFTKVAALAIIMLALYNLNSALILTGKPIAFSDLAKSINCSISFCGQEGASSSEPVKQATIVIDDRGYSPDVITVKSKSDVTLNLTNKNGAGCIQAFTIPSLNIQQVIPIGTSSTIAFRAPDQPQDIPFMCSMGMYRGTIRVI